jgi:hypothetical protein
MICGHWFGKEILYYPNNYHSHFIIFMRDGQQYTCMFFFRAVTGSSLSQHSPKELGGCSVHFAKIELIYYIDNILQNR